MKKREEKKTPYDWLNIYTQQHDKIWFTCEKGKAAKHCFSRWNACLTRFVSNLIIIRKSFYTTKNAQTIKSKTNGQKTQRTPIEHLIRILCIPLFDIDHNCQFSFAVSCTHRMSNLTILLLLLVFVVAQQPSPQSVRLRHRNFTVNIQTWNYNHAFSFGIVSCKSQPVSLKVRSYHKYFIQVKCICIEIDRYSINK